MAELKSTLPDTRAKKAIIARSRLLTDFVWTPLRDVPTYDENSIIKKEKALYGFLLFYVSLLF